MTEPHQDAEPDVAAPDSQDDGLERQVEPEPEPTLEAQLAERTADLQRLQAEYVNYKRRVDRDRELVRSQGESTVLRSLLTVLDDVGRAEQHGELTGGFKAVADSLHAAVKQHGLEANLFLAPGEGEAEQEAEGAAAGREASSNALSEAVRLIRG